MIVYLDASALVKRYVAETGSAAVGKLIDQAEALGTSVISRAEVSAAFAKAVRLKFVTRDAAASAMKQFAADWPHFIRLQLTENLVARSASKGMFSAAQYRDATGIGRTRAIKILEFFDTLGITQRIGDTRKMHKNFVPILGAAKPVLAATPTTSKDVRARRKS